MMGKLFGPRQRGGRCRRKPVQLHFEAMESRLLLATFLVDNTNDSGFGSLRQAIVNANATPGTYTIDFFINSTGVPVIAPASPLPEIKNPVFIDGISQPGSGLVEISGAGAGQGADGLSISAGNSLVAGLAIVKFGGSGIRLTTRGGNFIADDLIGTDSSGASGLGNKGDAVTIVGAPDNTIGGTALGSSNVISGNSGNGVAIIGSGASDNVVEGDFIGTNASGASAIANGQNGVYISDASDNTVGGVTSGAGDLISGNTDSGVYITTSQGTAIANLIEGDTIGANEAGNNTLGNGQDGVAIVGNLENGAVVNAPSGNFIGGTSVGAGNVIVGNALDGVYISNGAMANQVLGNHIGVGSGEKVFAMPNGESGVEISDASNNVIGGTDLDARNVISGNDYFGISIYQHQLTASSNLVEGNYIGTDADSGFSIPNGLFGVLILSASDNTIGGTTPGAANIISGNKFYGIFIGDGNANVVSGNYIGLVKNQSYSIGNGSDGILLDDAPDTIIGGATPGAGNIISGNSEDGIHIESNSETASGILVEGNYIGTDVTGTPHTWWGTGDPGLSSTLWTASQSVVQLQVRAISSREIPAMVLPSSVRVRQTTLSRAISSAPT